MAVLRRAGVLYLENDLAPRPFAPTRIAVLKLPASQAAISHEDTRRCRDLEQREAKIRRLVDTTGADIRLQKARIGTTETTRSSADLRLTNLRLGVDFDEPMGRPWLRVSKSGLRFPRIDWACRAWRRARWLAGALEFTSMRASKAGDQIQSPPTGETRRMSMSGVRSSPRKARSATSPLRSTSPAGILLAVRCILNCGFREQGRT
jgi:hypothetical protein